MKFTFNYNNTIHFKWSNIIINNFNFIRILLSGSLTKFTNHSKIE